MKSKITIHLQCSEAQKAEIHAAFQNGCGRRRANILATNEQIQEWLENGWIERRKDQDLPYYELKVF